MKYIMNGGLLVGSRDGANLGNREGGRVTEHFHVWI
jgi:glucan phosphorylase